MSTKATSVPQLGNHSQYSSLVEALNLIDESKSLPFEANNSTIKLHLPVEAKEKIAMIDESKSLPVEANNSTIELHLPVETKEKLSEYIESKSLPVEVKENFAIVNSSKLFCGEKINHSPSCDIDNQRNIFHQKRLSRATKHFLKSTFKRKFRRDREPSRIPIKKVLNCLRKKCYRTAMKRFISKNLPVSSRLHNLCKHYRAWCFPYNRVNGCSWNVLSI